MVVRKRTSKGVEYLPDHPLQKVLDFPDASMTQFDLLQSYSCHQNLFGNVTQLLLREGMQKPCDVCQEERNEDCAHRLYVNNTGKIVQIRTIHPSLIQQKQFAMEDGTKKTFFVYRPYGVSGQDYLIHPDNILTDPIYNPAIGWYGVSPTFLIKRWLDLDSYKTHQISQFFKNGAIPSLIVTLKPPTDGSAYEEEPQTILDMLKANWVKKFSSNGTEEKTPAFLYGDITVEKLQQSVNEMMSKDMYAEIEGRVTATYGIPANLYNFGIQYASQKAASEGLEKAFYGRTIAKALTRILQKYTNLVLPSYGDPELELEWDLSGIYCADYVIQAWEDKMLKRWEEGVIKRDEVRIALKLPTVGGEEGDEYFRRTVMTDGSINSGSPNSPGGINDNKLKVPDPNTPVRK